MPVFRITSFLSVFLLAVAPLPGALAAAVPQPHHAKAAAMAPSVVLARGVISRRFGPTALQGVQLQVLPGQVKLDTFEYEAHGGQLTVRGSSPIALTSGYYQFIKHSGIGMSTWDGTRFARPQSWPDTPRTRVSTPYQFRYYFNVVTYGYTMPYWTWSRWQREIDWMALHGVNMPLALLGTEAIGDRVWKKLGLTQAEIDAHFTGPAFLPWQRMGNVNKHDGPFPASWDTEQVALQHQVLRQMRALGMKPIAPGFAGFVPLGFKRLHPDVTLHQTHWGGLPDSESAYLLDARSPQFGEIGKMFVQEWEKEFGKAAFFLADSFNEMELPPGTEAEKNQLLADYGDSIYRSIQAGDPNAVWVIQGWMLGYQRNIWSKDALFALASKVPDDKMLFLDLAADYNATKWNQGPNWDFYQGFAGKKWVFSVIPNMGGKTPWTGHLDYYAKASARALNSANRGQLVGSGFAPEGIENNEALYELLSDNWWRTQPVSLDDWLGSYCRARYGAYPPAMKTAWNYFRQSSYGTFFDFPALNWQTRNLANTPIQSDPNFYRAVQSFLSCSEQLKGSSLYRADAIELAALYLSFKAQDDFLLVKQARQQNVDTPAVQEILAHGEQALRDADQLLASHPILRLERWLYFARSHGTTPQEKDYYEQDARRILVQWGGGDYSARVWSGLIRDFYLPRLEAMNASPSSDPSPDINALTEKWIMSPGTSPIKPFADPVQMAATLVDSAHNWQTPALPEMTSPYQWSSGQVGEAWIEKQWDISAKITQAGMVKAAFFYTSGQHRLDIRQVELLENGKVVAHDEHDGTTGLVNRANSYQLQLPSVTPGATYMLRASIRSDGGNDSNGETFVSNPATAQKEIYIAVKDRGNDYTNNDSKYSNFRKVETPDIALFWDKVYGDDPTHNPDATKRFNVNEVLQEAERYYDYYVNVLKFVEKGHSVTDQYKVLVYVTYKEGDSGTAYGSGADKKIGIFWTPASRISKGPYGVVAHELGHSFQYLVGADGNWGFGSGGVIWEMTSQYMLWQVLPDWMTFENYHLKEFMKNTNLAFLHEDNQYHSPYVLEYWSNKHGLDFVGKLWRDAQPGEDAVMTYKRITGITQDQFNDEMFDADRRFITWDMKRIEQVAAKYANQHTTELNPIEDGWYRIAPGKCPQNYGYNGIQLVVPAAGTQVTLDFKGIAGAAGYRAINVDKAGWRYGFLAVKEDGSREYGATYSKSKGQATFVVPEKTNFLWLVVSGAPTEHWQHIADKDESNDEQWPYSIKLSGTAPQSSIVK